MESFVLCKEMLLKYQENDHLFHYFLLIVTANTSKQLVEHIVIMFL